MSFFSTTSHVSEEVLELARRKAKRMMVGKRGQRESCAQADINALMLKLARQGKHVVRLKSGDPMVFGRAGEEISALEAAGIPVTVVPGVTSAQAMAAALNRSLTHRDHAQSLTLMTGHSRKGELPETIDWQRAAARNANYKKPFPWEQEAMLEGWKEKVEARKIFAAAEIRSNDTVFVTATGLFIDVDIENFKDRREALRQQYGF